MLVNRRVSIVTVLFCPLFSAAMEVKFFACAGSKAMVIVAVLFFSVSQFSRLGPAVQVNFYVEGITQYLVLYWTVVLLRNSL